MTRIDGAERSSPVPPARRAPRTLRVRARFTPTRSAVYRRDTADPVQGAEEYVEAVDAPAGEFVAPVEAFPSAAPDSAPDTAADPVADPSAHDAAEDEQGLLETLFALPDAHPDSGAAPRPDHTGAPGPVPGEVPRPAPPVEAAPAVGAAPFRVGRRGWWWPVVAGVAVIALVVVLIVRGSTDDPTDTGSVAAPSGPGSNAAVPAPAGLAAWLAAGGADVPVFADGTAAADAVVAAGVRPDAGGTAAALPGDRVVRRVTGDPAAVVAASAGAALVPVASFPAAGGGAALVGGVVVRGAATDVSAARATAADTARAASEALTRNAAVTFSSEARAVLGRGDVDIRITAFVAALAETGQVQVVSFGVVTSERAVGVPVRTLVLTAAPDVVRVLAAGARGTYAPSSVTTAADARTTLTWSVEPDPAALTVR